MKFNKMSVNIYSSGTEILWGFKQLKANKEKRERGLTARAVEYELKMLILNSFSAFLKTTSTMVSFLPSSDSRSAIWRDKCFSSKQLRQQTAKQAVNAFSVVILDYMKT